MTDRHRRLLEQSGQLAFDGLGRPDVRTVVHDEHLIRNNGRRRRWFKAAFAISPSAINDSSGASRQSFMFKTDVQSLQGIAPRKVNGPLPHEPMALRLAARTVVRAPNQIGEACDNYLTRTLCVADVQIRIVDISLCRRAARANHRSRDDWEARLQSLCQDERVSKIGNKFSRRLIQRAVCFVGMRFAFGR
ncbi:MAG TPA: hypothetical protein VKA15_02695 [Isosphaeraceae bacterium]|nr:hypothetical protein [Isosphaeraceae bacterium]